MKKKIFALALAFVLVISSTVGITLAWLTSSTGKITNTFTVGNVSIKLREETNVTDPDPSASNVYIIKDAAATVSGYHIVPGRKEHKAPFVEVDSNSEDCYVYIAVKDNLGGNVAYTINEKVGDGSESAKTWEKVDLSNNDTTVKLYKYFVGIKQVPTDDLSTPYDQKPNYVVEAGTTTGTLFNEVTYGDGLTYVDIKDLDGKTIQIKAFAIQAASVTVDAADGEAKTWVSGLDWTK